MAYNPFEAMANEWESLSYAEETVQLNLVN